MKREKERKSEIGRERERPVERDDENRDREKNNGWVSFW